MGQLDALRHEPTEKRIPAPYLLEPPLPVRYYLAADDVRTDLLAPSEIVDRIAFFDERVDLLVDGMRADRPITPWSPPG